MALYAYKAMNPGGRLVQGQIEALNLVDLEMRLKRMELDLINGSPARHSLASGLGRMPVRERSLFCFHLEQLTRAGVPLIEALIDLRDSTDHPRMRAVIANLVESIEGGRSLSQALSEQGNVFDPVFCSLVRAGETSGNLPDVLRELNEALKREDELSSYVKKLTIYPGFVLSVTLLAVFVSMVYVVPELAKLFRSTGVALPLQTRLLMGTSRIVSNWWPLILATLASLVVILASLIRTRPDAARRWDAFKLGLPIVGNVYRKIILSRFANLFAMMYASGISIIDTIRVAQDVVGNRVLRDALERVEQLIAEGQNVTMAFAATGIFPPLVVRMLRVGEHTGSLDQALRNVSYFYERDVRESIANLQAMLEPLLILLLGGLMMWVALSVLGPIYDVITKMKF
ncbi:type II secretion system F family protein [Uliginosibacterium aquaticum]|uniref:Type II secretion system F family protein n=1 Tax=Uliginosibacterium aquaticum TaxID=2731212 RepID=A0ABX2IPL6_9RHOO|nr:type II secretion system F family protein [Uliginosibacterium aquaticum]NSL56634.1 type II secretion system F family protein [Uliginosibacterium aquaticum]